jgi:hypothetical protein
MDKTMVDARKLDGLGKARVKSLLGILALADRIVGILLALEVFRLCQSLHLSRAHYCARTWLA